VYRSGGEIKESGIYYILKRYETSIIYKLMKISEEITILI
jgi:hypothetical protein